MKCFIYLSLWCSRKLTIARLNIVLIRVELRGKYALNHASKNSFQLYCEGRESPKCKRGKHLLCGHHWSFYQDNIIPWCCQRGLWKLKNRWRMFSLTPKGQPRVKQSVWGITTAVPKLWLTLPAVSWKRWFISLTHSPTAKKAKWEKKRQKKTWEPTWATFPQHIHFL